MWVVRILYWTSLTCIRCKVPIQHTMLLFILISSSHTRFLFYLCSLKFWFISVLQFTFYITGTPRTPLQVPQSLTNPLLQPAGERGKEKIKAKGEKITILLGKQKCVLFLGARLLEQEYKTQKLRVNNDPPFFNPKSSTSRTSRIVNALG